MTDIVDDKTRSRMMSGIQGKNTRPELVIRSGLHRSGYRFRIHYGELPGRPDIVLPKYRAIIIVNGCFWHGHNCRLFKWPRTRADFWEKKIKGNIERDRRNLRYYRATGWRVLTIWECAVRGMSEANIGILFAEVEAWLGSDRRFLEIPEA